MKEQNKLSFKLLNISYLFVQNIQISVHIIWANRNNKYEGEPEIAG
jgi:hypothetical protein